jgi:4-cresol dehydrogenase (hydroxylating)
MNGPSRDLDAWAGLPDSTEVRAGGQQRDIGAHRPRATLATLRPGATRDVQEIARRDLPVWPVSTGRNWGLGSRMPPADGYSIVDLSRLARIRELDIAHGIAVIEPGVTQAQLARAVQGTGWMVNLTGSCARTSILGNTLANGDGVIRPRAHDVAGIEAVLPGGQVITTGTLTGGRAAAPPAGLEALPAGALVTAMTVRLVHTPAAVCVVHARVEPGAAASAVAALQHCLTQDLCTAMPRLFSGNVIVPVPGPAGTTHEKAAAAAGRLRSTPGLSAVRIVPASPALPAGDPLRPVLDLLAGRPTCEMVRQAFRLPCEDLDTHGPGWLAVLPLLPLAAAPLSRAIRAWQETARPYGIPLAAEIILAAPHLAHGVLQISFARASSDRARSLRDALIDRLADEGMPPYRTDIDHVGDPRPASARRA